MNALADEEIELADSQVRRHQVLLLVEVSNAGLRCFLDDDLKRECALESGQPKNDGDNLAAHHFWQAAKKISFTNKSLYAVLIIFIYAKKSRFNNS